MTRTMGFKQLAMATGAAALVLLLIWYMALFKPQSHKLTQTRQAVAVAQTKISSLQQQEQQLQALVKQIPSDTAKLAKYQQAVPGTPELATAIREIQAAADSTSVVMSTLDPTVPTSGSPSSSGSVAGAQAIPVTISASGSYSGLTSFIQTLESMPRTLVVQSFTLGGKGNTMTSSISSDIYFTGS